MSRETQANEALCLEQRSIPRRVTVFLTSKSLESGRAVHTYETGYTTLKCVRAGLLSRLPEHYFRGNVLHSCFLFFFCFFLIFIFGTERDRA